MSLSYHRHKYVNILPNFSKFPLLKPRKLTRNSNSPKKTRNYKILQRVSPSSSSLGSIRPRIFTSKDSSKPKKDSIVLPKISVVKIKPKKQFVEKDKNNPVSITSLGQSLSNNSLSIWETMPSAFIETIKLYKPKVVPKSLKLISSSEISDHVTNSLSFPRSLSTYKKHKNIRKTFSEMKKNKDLLYFSSTKPLNNEHW
jgi:hypothetical protein